MGCRNGSCEYDVNLSRGREVWRYVVCIACGRSMRKYENFLDMQAWGGICKYCRRKAWKMMREEEKRKNEGEIIKNGSM